MSIVLGVDTSNYTTSVAIYDGSAIKHEKKLLPVKKGERGIRQSDAVFHHTKAYPSLIARVFDGLDETVSAVGASVTPTTQEGSYMPCFLVGEGFARGLAASLNVPFYGFSHQQGHIAAALYSAGKTDLIHKEFLAFHISGGTTDLVLCKPDGNIFKTEPVASSSDLKAGQAVDRIGIKMGLDFPAGAELEKLAEKSYKTYKNKIKLTEDGFCSLSGLENKCLKMLENCETREDVAKFLLAYIGDVVCAMTEKALSKFGDMPVVYAGGVMSNKLIKNQVSQRFTAYFAEPEFSCDNAAGIAILTSLMK